jgi:probable addiction module antidote protein
MNLRDFNETFGHRLRDKRYLSAYLTACLAEGPPAFYVGLRNAVQSHEGGFSWLARETGMVRAGLYQALSANGNPSFRTVHSVLVALGVDPSFVAGAVPETEMDLTAA